MSQGLISLFRFILQIIVFIEVCSISFFYWKRDLIIIFSREKTPHSQCVSGSIAEKRNALESATRFNDALKQE